MNGAAASAPISWLGSMLSVGDAVPAATFDGSAAGSPLDFATRLAALRLPAAAAGGGLRIGGDASGRGGAELADDEVDHAAFSTLIAALPAAAVMDEPSPPRFGGAVRGVDLPSLGDPTAASASAGETVTENVPAEVLASSSLATLAMESPLQNPLAPTGVRLDSQKKAPAGPFTASGRLDAVPLQSLGSLTGAASTVAMDPSTTSMFSMISKTSMTSVTSKTSTTSLTPEGPLRAGEGSGETLAAIGPTGAALVSPVPDAGKLTTVAVLVADGAAAALEVEAALEQLEPATDLESMEAESSAPDAAIEATQARPVLQNLAAVAQGVQIEAQRGRDAQAAQDRAWRLTAGDVGRRAAAHTELPMRAVSSANPMAGLHAPARDAAANLPTQSPAPLATPLAAAPLPIESAGGRQQSAAVAVLSPGTGAHVAARAVQTDADDVDAPRVTLAQGITSDVPSAALRGPSALETNTNLLDLGARLRLAVADVIVDAGRDRLLESVRDTFQARVTVHPPNLGTVQVQVTRESATSGLNILLVAAHQDGARALESESDNLIDDLVRHRLEVNEVNVRRGEGSSTDQPRDGQQRPSAQDQNARERREQQQAQERADDRQPGHRRSPDARWEFASPFVSQSIAQDAQGSDRP